MKNLENKIKNIIIAPSILSCDFSQLKEEVLRVIQGGADWLHIDIMDGHFVPNISFGPLVVKSLKNSLVNHPIFFDCHLMVTDPGKWIASFQESGADQITFHFEAVNNNVNDAIELASLIRDKNMKAGLSIKPGTSLNSVECALNSGLFHTLLIMTVEPGFGGQAFIYEMKEKTVEARKKYPYLNIQVDGGINEYTIQEAANWGANAFVAGTSVFKSESPSKTIQLLRNKATTVS